MSKAFRVLRNRKGFYPPFGLLTPSTGKIPNLPCEKFCFAIAVAKAMAHLKKIAFVRFTRVLNKSQSQVPLPRASPAQIPNSKRFQYVIFNSHSMPPAPRAFTLFDFWNKSRRIFRIVFVSFSTPDTCPGRRTKRSRRRGWQRNRGRSYYLLRYMTLHLNFNQQEIEFFSL